MTRQETDLAHFDRIARQTVAMLPAPFAALAAAVALRVIDWPPREILDDLEIDDPLDLTGLYDGIPVTEKSWMDQPMGPDVVWIFRRPILDEWQARGDVALDDLIAHVVVHEFAHHFGWSDDQIAAIDPWWE